MAEEVGSVEIIIRARQDVLQEGLAAARKQLNEFDRAVAKPTAASRGFEQANKGASEALRKLSTNIAILQGPLGPIAGRVSFLATGIMNMGFTTVAAGVALTGLVGILGKAVHEFAALEREQVTYNAVLRATGFAAGKTSAELEELEGSLRRTIGATESEVRRAMAVLLTFTGIGGDQFVQTLKAAKDLSGILGGDMVSAVRMLGRASEDPAQGMMMLRRAGILLGGTQKEQIKIFTESGQRMKAFQVILDESQRRLGGTAAAQRGTLSGAFTQLTEATSNWFELIGGKLARATKFNEILNAMAVLIDKINRGMEIESSPEGAIAAASARVMAAEAALAQAALEAKTGVTKLGAPSMRLVAPVTKEGVPQRETRELIQARAELADAEQALGAATLTRGAAQKKADEGMKAEDTRRRQNAIEGVVAALDLEAEQLRMTAKERAVDEALRKAQLKLTDDQVTAGSKLTQTERARVTAQAESIFILKSESGLLQGKIGLLGELATVSQRVAAGEAQIKDAQLASMELTAQEITLLRERNAVRANEAVISEGAQLGIGSAEDLAAQKQREINLLVKQYGEEWRDVITIGMDKKFRDLGDSIAVAGSRLPEFTRAMREATDMGRQVDQNLTRSVDTLSGSLTDIVTRTTDAKTAFANMAQSIIRDFTQMAIKAMLFRAASSFIGGGGFGGGGGFLASLFGGGGGSSVGLLTTATATLHGGGIVGVDAAPRRVDAASNYVNAPRFHDGLVPGEFRAVLKKDEGVFTPGQMRALGRRGDTYNIDARGADPAGLARLESVIRELHGSIEHRSVAAVVDARQRNPSLFGVGTP